MNSTINSLIILLLCVGTIPAASGIPDKSEALDILKRVNNYWQSRNAPTGRAFWDNAAYHTGNMEAWRVTEISDYLEYSLAWSEANQWKGAKSNNTSVWRYDYGETDNHVLFGDWQICFQTYIDLYNHYNDPKMIARATEVMEYQMGTDFNGYWWWADGLYMVMPVMTKLYNVSQNELYLDKLYEYFQYAKSIMYDEETGLFFRDAKYVYPQHTSYNGKKDFWARGDGWVFAGLAKVLQDIPPTSSYKEEFLAIFTKMAQTLADAMQPEGYWTRSLLDPEHAPGYETSGTAFFTYGFLWGINNGILDANTYLPVALSAWHYLTTVALQSNGHVGYVQPIGERAIPGQVVNAQSTSNFGVGAFLLACAEMIRLGQGGMPFFINSITLQDEQNVSVQFNQVIDIASATDILNYTSSTLSILSATPLPDSTGVVLNCDPISPGKHEISVGEIVSASGDTLKSTSPLSFISSGSITVTASSYESGSSNVPDNTLDFNLNTRWSSEGKGQWLLFDLNALKSISSVDISYFKGDERINYLTIELSDDGTTFREVFSGQSSGKTAETETYSFPEQKARFVRIIGNGNSENAWNSITEVHIKYETTTKISRRWTASRSIPAVHILQSSSRLTIFHPFEHPAIATVRIFTTQGKLLHCRSVLFSDDHALITGVSLAAGLYYVTVGSVAPSAYPLLVR